MHDDDVIIGMGHAQLFTKRQTKGMINEVAKETKHPKKYYDQIRSMIKEHKNIQKIIKKNNLKLNEVPIIVHCYDKNCNYDHELANQLFRAGYTNVINYSEGILGYMGRTRYN